ncbi:hypothetical protein K7432_015961 [Basidiobolus ranarum]|uniref:Uncharacterized protein n=1 Tax=Basidiobolus ranarum TaxID=34480 RepID=A0ABR2VM97_9FUNG
MSQFVSSQWEQKPPINSMPPLVCPSNSPVEYLEDVGCSKIRASYGGIYVPCCELKEKCYQTCGATKLLCEEQFRHCMLTSCPSVMEKYPEEGNSTTCTQHWGRMGGDGPLMWRLSQSKEFSCDAFEEGQTKGGCSIKESSAYGIIKRDSLHWGILQEDSFISRASRILPPNFSFSINIWKKAT